MKLRRIVLSVLGVLLAFLIAAPLRAIKERTYRSEERSVLDGTIYAEADGEYRSMPVRFWFAGLQTGAPYRLRIFYRPADSREHHLSFSRVSIDSHDLPLPESGAPWQRDRDGSPTAIIGFLNAPLSADESVLRVELSEDDRRISSELRLVRQSRLKIVHAGIEALMGI